VTGRSTNNKGKTVDGYKLNKLVGSIILAVLIIMGIKELNNQLNHPEEPEQQAYVIEGVEPEGGPSAAAAPAEVVPVVSLAMRLASADAVAGAKVFKKCTQCHTIDPGGRNLQGPNLYNIIGAPIGGKEFKYSKNVAANGGTWDYEALDAWLKKPSAYIKRTKMVLALKKDKDRANVILFLRENADNPPPLPVVDLAPAVEPAIEEAAPEAVPEAVPEAAPETAPDAVPGVVPGVGEEAPAEAEAGEAAAS
jgi:cytochrome c